MNEKVEGVLTKVKATEKDEKNTNTGTTIMSLLLPFFSPYPHTSKSAYYTIILFFYLKIDIVGFRQHI